MDALQNDGPIVLKLNSGVMRPVQIAWAERTPAAWGLFAFWLIIMLALYKNRTALWGLILVGVWHGYWALAARKDPQYYEVMIRNLRFRWPGYVAAWPGVGARAVKVEASVPSAGGSWGLR